MAASTIFAILILFVFIYTNYMNVNEFRLPTATNRKAAAALAQFQAGVELLQSDPARAEGHFLSALPLWENLVREVPSELDYQINLEATRTDLALTALAQGRLAEGREQLNRCAAQWDALAASLLSESQQTLVQRNRGLVRDTLGVEFQRQGFEFQRQGKQDEAIASWRAAIRLKPDDAQAHYNLGLALGASGDLKGAIAAYRAAIRLRPDYADAHWFLGLDLAASGDLPGAIAEYRTAIRLKPDLAQAHYNLGLALDWSGDKPGAIAAYRAAIRLRPDYADAHCYLGLALLNRGSYGKALDELRRGHALGSKLPGWPYPSAEWVRRAERLASLATRLPAVLAGEDKPADAAERLDFALMAYHSRRYATSARLFAEALEAAPTLADDLEAAHRYNAACAAALAGCGKGRDDPSPDDAGRTKLRGQALDWLRADLALRRRQLDTDAAAARRALDHWRRDPDLAGVRDADTLAALPEAERDDWRALWVEVDRLLERSGKAP
jgi:tetratricopeptide (TPR) repeat protein